MHLILQVTRCPWEKLTIHHTLIRIKRLLTMAGRMDGWILHMYHKLSLKDYSHQTNIAIETRSLQSSQQITQDKIDLYKIDSV